MYASFFWVLFVKGQFQNTSRSSWTAIEDLLGACLNGKRPN